MLVQRFLDLLFGHVADDLLFHLAALEHEQRRDAAHTVPHRSGVVAVHVHFADLDLTGVLASQLFHNGSNGAARTAPSRPKVHQYWCLRFQDILVKVLVRNFHNSVSRHSSSTRVCATQYRNTKYLMLEGGESRRRETLSALGSRLS